MSSTGKEHGVEDGDHGDHAHAHQPVLTVKRRFDFGDLRLDFAKGLQQVFFRKPNVAAWEDPPRRIGPFIRTL